jgi:hypothetical protein
MFAIVGITDRSGFVWHAVQAAPDLNGIWFAGVALAVKSFKLEWQLEHSPVLGCEASATWKVPAVACGRVWKPLNGALVVIGY